MAKKRMFSTQIVDSDAFMDMPTSAQSLYFHLCIRADDEGFVGNPKKIMRMIGVNEDDFKVLLGKRFILAFENGIVVIKHWLIHNTIRMDRFNPTTYQKEKKLLITKENKAYTEWQPIGNQLATQVKLSKVSISKYNTPVAQEKFSLEEYLKKMEDDPRRAINVIGHYFEEKDLKFGNAEEAQVAIKRHLRAATEVAKFTDDKIVKATDIAKREYGDKFTVGTVLKMLTK